MISGITLRTISLFSALLFAYAAHAAPPPAAQTADSNSKCYSPYSSSKDHMITGCEIPGYRMHSDIAQQAGILMVLLPEGFSDLDKAPVFFMVNTLELGDGDVQSLFTADLKTMLADKPKIKVTDHTVSEKPKKMGTCVGARLKLPAGEHFPYELYYICKNKSSKYAIQIGLQARTEDLLRKHKSRFLKWADIPQLVVDAKVIDPMKP